MHSCVCSGLMGNRRARWMLLSVVWTLPFWIWDNQTKFHWHIFYVPVVFQECCPSSPPHVCLRISICFSHFLLFFLCIKGAYDFVLISQCCPTVQGFHVVFIPSACHSLLFLLHLLYRGCQVAFSFLGTSTFPAGFAILYKQRKKLELELF